MNDQPRLFIAIALSFVVFLVWQFIFVDDEKEKVQPPQPVIEAPVAPGQPPAIEKEKEIAAFSELKNFPIIPCNLCGTQDNMQRQEIKNMLADWDRQYPGRLEIMFKSLRNVAPSHLCDTQLFDFSGLFRKYFLLIQDILKVLVYFC